MKWKKGREKRGCRWERRDEENPEAAGLCVERRRWTIHEQFTCEICLSFVLRRRVWNNKSSGEETFGFRCTGSAVWLADRCVAVIYGDAFFFGTEQLKVASGGFEFPDLWIFVIRWLFLLPQLHRWSRQAWDARNACYFSSAVFRCFPPNICTWYTSKHKAAPPSYYHRNALLKSHKL